MIIISSNRLGLQQVYVIQEFEEMKHAERAVE